MSDPEAVRAVALDAAVKFIGANGGAGDVISAANSFLGFLQGAATGPATRSAAGSEPATQKEGKPSANTAAKKAAKAAAEQTAAKEALARAEAQDPPDEPTDPTEPFEATQEGVAAAVAAMISNKTDASKPNRDTAIALLKEFKAASTSAMQGKDEKTIAKFIAKVNEVFGLNAEPDLEG